MKEFYNLDSKFQLILRLIGLNLFDVKYQRSFMTYIVGLWLLSVHLSTFKAIYFNWPKMDMVILSLTTYFHCFQVTHNHNAQ